MYNHPIGKDYKWYISGIFPATWGIIWYLITTFFGGTRFHSIDLEILPQNPCSLINFPEGARSRAAAGKLGHGCLARGDVRQVENVATSHGGAAALPNRKKRPPKKYGQKTPGEVFLLVKTKKNNAVGWMEVVFVCVFFPKGWKSWMLFGEGWVDIKSFFFPGEMGFFMGEVDIKPTFDEFLVGKAIAEMVWWKIKNENLLVIPSNLVLWSCVLLFLVGDAKQNGSWGKIEWKDIVKVCRGTAGRYACFVAEGSRGERQFRISKWYYHDDIWHMFVSSLVQRLIPRLRGTRLPWKRLDFRKSFVGSRGRSATYLKPIQLKVQSAQWVFGLWFSCCSPCQQGNGAWILWIIWRCILYVFCVERM